MAHNAQDIGVEIGILGWEAGSGDTLAQLELIPGNVAHPDTFQFPVRYVRVKGAHYRTVVVEPSLMVLEAMILAAKELERDGVRAIMTSCGFNALFQAELAGAVSVPVFASSLLQVPLVLRLLSQHQQVGIITADRAYLTAAHLRAVGVSDDAPLCIAGLENSAEFARALRAPDEAVNVPQFEQEVVDIACKLARDSGNLGAIVLECTDLPPFSAAIRRALNLPVFDLVTLAHLIHESLAGDRWRWQR